MKLSKEEIEKLKGYERIITQLKKEGFTTVMSIRCYLQEIAKLEKENEKLKKELERWKERCAEIYLEG